MTTLRVYIGALTVILCLAVVRSGQFGPPEYVVASFPLLYLILDMAEELRDLKRLEKQVESAQRS